MILIVFQIIFSNNLNNMYMIQDYYNRITNKFNYTRTYPQTTNYYNMYIKPYNTSKFLGLLNNVEHFINLSATECIYPINIITIKTLCIGVSGDISFNFNNMESNTNGIYKASDLILVKSVDVYKNELIKYDNIDGGIVLDTV
jgi:hypothetical protein